MAIVIGAATFATGLWVFGSKSAGWFVVGGALSFGPALAAVLATFRVRRTADRSPGLIDELRAFRGDASRSSADILLDYDSGQPVALTAKSLSGLRADLDARAKEFPALTADFTEDRTTHLLNKPIRGTGTIAFHAPGKFRRELKGTSPSLTVCNGKELWIYYPNFTEAEHYTLGKKQFFDDSLAALTAGLNFTDVEKYFRIAAAKDGPATRITVELRED
ncbi:MAG: outer membrane lipoprotein carrier protein LolA [Actinomycetota bacterium]